MSVSSQAGTPSTFYQTIPPIQNISEITDLSNYFDVPADWFIALTDVKGSTQAIENGRYKDVNAIAVASITALLNHTPELDLPFMFGGDGATILIPPHIVQEAADSLLATRQLAANYFNLELRVGIVPVRDVLADGYRIRVARLKMSENFQQAVFTGGGLSYAEKLLKNPPPGKQYRLEDGEIHEADFSGFECRWQAIPSPYEETISLMVTVLLQDIQAANQVYQEVLHAIENIYGDAQSRHPITVDNMHLTFNPRLLSIEARVRHHERSWRRLFKMMRGSFKAWVAMRFGIGRWGEYRKIFTGATDHEKFDDTLRMIIAGTSQQREQLRKYLEERRRRGELAYGIHASSHALVTCIVYDYFGRQVHFVDSADGGYALAARQMKEQLKSLQA